MRRLCSIDVTGSLNNSNYPSLKYRIAAVISVSEAVMMSVVFTVTLTRSDQINQSREGCQRQRPCQTRGR